MIKIKKVEHVGVAVRNADEVASFYNLLGIKVHGREELPDGGLKVAMLPIGESELELLEPTAEDSTVAKYLEKRGEGIHHLALCVEDIDSAVEELMANGIRMIDKKARTGAGGKKVAFVHPQASHGVLIELVQDCD